MQDRKKTPPQDVGKAINLLGRQVESLKNEKKSTPAGTEGPSFFSRFGRMLSDWLGLMDRVYIDFLPLEQQSIHLPLLQKQKQLMDELLSKKLVETKSSALDFAPAKPSLIPLSQTLFATSALSPIRPKKTLVLADIPTAVLNQIFNNFLELDDILQLQKSSKHLARESNQAIRHLLHAAINSQSIRRRLFTDKRFKAISLAWYPDDMDRNFITLARFIYEFNGLLDLYALLTKIENLNQIFSGLLLQKNSYGHSIMDVAASRRDYVTLECFYPFCRYYLVGMNSRFILDPVKDASYKEQIHILDCQAAPLYIKTILEDETISVSILIPVAKSLNIYFFEALIEKFFPAKVDPLCISPLSIHNKCDLEFIGALWKVCIESRENRFFQLAIKIFNRAKSYNPDLAAMGDDSLIKMINEKNLLRVAVGFGTADMVKNLFDYGAIIFPDSYYVNHSEANFLLQVAANRADVGILSLLYHYAKTHGMYVASLTYGRILPVFTKAGRLTWMRSLMTEDEYQYLRMDTQLLSGSFYGPHANVDAIKFIRKSWFENCKFDMLTFNGLLKSTFDSPLAEINVANYLLTEVFENIDDSCLSDNPIDWNTPLCRAIENGREDLVNLLLTHKADLASPQIFSAALASFKPGLVKRVILVYKAEITAKKPEEKLLPTKRMDYLDSEKDLSKLLKGKLRDLLFSMLSKQRWADIDFMNSDALEILEILIEAGANVNEVYDGHTSTYLEGESVLTGALNLLQPATQPIAIFYNIVDILLTNNARIHQGLWHSPFMQVIAAISEEEDENAKKFYEGILRLFKKHRQRQVKHLVITHTEPSISSISIIDELLEKEKIADKIQQFEAGDETMKDIINTLLVQADEDEQVLLYGRLVETAKFHEVLPLRFESVALMQDVEIDAHATEEGFGLDI